MVSLLLFNHQEETLGPAWLQALRNLLSYTFREAYMLFSKIEFQNVQGKSDIMQFKILR